jgi:hypothetical protein
MHLLFFFSYRPGLEPTSTVLVLSTATTAPFDLVDKLFDFIDISRCLRAPTIIVTDRRIAGGSHNPATQFPHSRPNHDHHWTRHANQRGSMTELQNRLAAEREEIATRLAIFKATQEKFEREREEYFVATLENARHSSGRSPSWS